MNMMKTVSSRKASEDLIAAGPSYIGAQRC